MRRITICFNPRIGIHFIHAHTAGLYDIKYSCFNPRIGIHFIHAE